MPDRKLDISAAIFWVASVLTAGAPVLQYFRHVVVLEQYGYVWILPIAVLMFVAYYWDKTLLFPTRVTDWVIWSAGIVAGGISNWYFSPWVGAVATCLIAFSWLRSHFQEDGNRLTFISVLLVVFVRLPFDYDTGLANYLQRFTSRVSSYFLDWIDITHHLRGNVIDLPSRTLFVEEACSGVQSLFTMLFLAALWMVFRKRPTLALPIYLSAAIAWAMVMNVMRITAIAIVAEWYGYDWSEGTPHDILGYVCLAIAAVFMLSTDRLLQVWFFPIFRDSKSLGELDYDDPVTRGWNRITLVGTSMVSSSDGTHPKLASNLRRVAGAIALVAMLACLFVGTPQLMASLAGVTAETRDELLWDPPKSLFAGTEWEPLLVDHQSLRGSNNRELGYHADAWTIAIDGLPVRVAVSQPYPEWHDMRDCYQGVGWQLNAWDKQAKSIVPELDFSTISRAEFVNNSGGYGNLLWCGLRATGERCQIPMESINSLLGDRFKDRKSLRSSTIMLQLWVPTQNPLLPSQMESIERLIVDFQELVENGLAQGSKSGADQ